MDKLPLEIVNNILVIRYDELKKKYDHLKKDNDNMSDFMYSNQIDMCDECGVYDDDRYIEYQEKYERFLCQCCFKVFQI